MLWTRDLLRRIASLLLLVLLASGCSTGPKHVVLRIANWGGAGSDSAVDQAYRWVFAEFERRHPGVEIQVEGTPGSQEYVNKMLLSFVAKSAPDVMTIDASSAAVFVDNGLIQDLAPYIAKDKSFDSSAYYPNVLDITRRADRLYSIPLDFTPMVVYYNKALFDAAGVPYPKEDWTTDDFLAKAKALTQNGKFGFDFTTWMPGWVMWLWNNGADVLSPDGSRASGYFDSPKSEETLRMLADMVLVDKSSPALSQAAAVGVDPFANGDCAMAVSGHWSLSTYASSPRLDIEKIGVAPMPHGPDMPSQTVMYEASVGITRDAKHPDLAWELVKWMTSAEAQRKIQSSLIAVCARKDVSQELAKNEREKSFLRIVSSARAPWGAKVKGYDFVETEGIKLMDGVCKNGLDLRDGLKAAVGRIDKHLAK